MATRTYKRLELGEYDIPAEALRLSEDIIRLEQIIDLLRHIDPDNCDGHFQMLSQASVSRQGAQRKLRLKFLSRV